MKIKLAMMASFSVFLLAGALLWLMDAKLTGQREETLERELRGAVASLSRSLQSDLRSWERVLATMNSSSSWGTFGEELPFYGVAQVRGQGSQIEVSQFSVNPKGRLAGWQAADLQKRLALSSASAFQSGKSQLFILNNSGQPAILTLTWRDRDKNWAALIGPEFLQAFLDLQKDSLSTFAIVNSAGEMLGHSTSEYVGTTVSKGSLYSSILSSPDVRAHQEFPQGEEGPVSASYEKIQKTNITILAFRSLTDLQAARWENLIFGLVATLGLGLVSISGVWWVATRMEKDLEAARQASPVTVAVSSPVPNRAPLSTGGALSPLAAPVLPPDPALPLRLASALGHELRGPLIAILGYCQMILASTSKSEIQEPTDGILRETRMARGILDKLLIYAGEKELEKKPGRIEGLIYKILKDEQPRLHRLFVKVNQQISETSPIPMADADLEKALRHLLENAVEAMDRMQKKEISIRLNEEEEGIRLEIQDTGEGMEEAQQVKALEPFYTTRSTKSHLGLGLPAAQGIIREHGGELSIQSKRGQGTRVSIFLPKQKKISRIAEKEIHLRTSSRVEIPGEVPRPQRQNLLQEDATMVSGAAGSGPADLDLDQLFSMPEVVEVDPKKVSEAVLDNDDRTVVLANEPSNPAEGSTPQKSSGGLISAPQFKAPQRSSRLDDVAVTIRRPGARVE